MMIGPEMGSVGNCEQRPMRITLVDVNQPARYVAALARTLR